MQVLEQVARGDRGRAGGDGLGQHARRGTCAVEGVDHPHERRRQAVDDHGLGRVGAELQDVGRAVQRRVSQTRPAREGRAREGGHGGEHGSREHTWFDAAEGRPDPAF
ncbi:hypothetical protein GCM10023199_20660 [Actinomycetospora chibensis]